MEADPLRGSKLVDGYDRYAFEYGPLLMAIKGKLDDKDHIIIQGEHTA